MSDQNQENEDSASEILKELRAENKRLKKELADAPASIRTQIDREYKAQSAFEKVGYPKLATAWLKDNAEAELNDEAVTAFLDDWGLEPRESAPKQEDVSGLQQVTTFADRIQAKASGQPSSIEDELKELDGKNLSPHELANAQAKILSKLGAGQEGAKTRY
jgi:hypothetical protein